MSRSCSWRAGQVGGEDPAVEGGTLSHLNPPGAVAGKPVAVILRPGKTPDGAEVAMVLRHVVRAIRAR
ncbi:hypothetical protein [Azospirillum sp. B506]|uniref:hypothetical protein n=1 Tax=Azospirillum sp. B506 TaxID=137721 RepID=UPI00131F3995